MPATTQKPEALQQLIEALRSGDADAALRLVLASVKA